MNHIKRISLEDHLLSASQDVPRRYIE